MTVADRISPAYDALQRELFARPEGYGNTGAVWASFVASLVARFSAASVLDYGAGRGTLAKALRPLLATDVWVAQYDPCVDGLTQPPPAVDLVVCTDVLEHVEPEKLDAVLAHLQQLARTAVFVAVSTRSASRELADGRNAHLIVESADWWRARFEAHGFTVEDGPKNPHPKPVREFVAVLTSARFAHSSERATC